jgi:hypothetical protein
MAKQKTKPKKKKKVATLVLSNFKLTALEENAIKKKALKYARGNYSAWLRHAGLNYRPKSGEIIR